MTGETILVVEDDGLIALYLTESDGKKWILRRLGFLR